MTAIDTIKVLDQLEMLVEDSKPKFMGFVKLDEDEFYMLVSKIRASLPEDMRRAGKIAENSDRIMEAAQEEAENALEDSRREAERMVAEAQAEAARAIETAREEAARAIESARYEATNMVDSANSQAAQMSGEAQTEADRLLMEARTKSATMTDQSEIARIAAAQAREVVAYAEEKARTLVARAEADAGEIRHGADDYARDVLFTLERHLQEAIGQFDTRFNTVLSTVQRGRIALEQGDSPQRSAANGSATDEASRLAVAGSGNGARRANGRR